MPKQSSLTIRDAHAAIQILATVAFDDFEKGLAFYDLLEPIGLKARGIDAERVKLVQKHGLKGVENATDSPQYPAFLAEYVRLMEMEHDVPDWPAVTVTAADLKGVRLSGQQIGAARKLGILVITAPVAPDIEPAKAVA